MLNPNLLVSEIKAIGKQLGFTEVGIAELDTGRAATLLKRWQALNNHGDMHYLQRHGMKRGHIRSVAPQAVSVISVSLNYLNASIAASTAQLDDTSAPYLSLYARNRDYHKVMRGMLKNFAKAIEELTDKDLHYRAIVDTAPVLDKSYAEQSGLGWVGKHSNILDSQHGSFYFLGELAVSLKLPADHAVKPRCGSCTACMAACPTQAIVAPYQLDVKRCISYLTIEHHGIIDDEFKPLIGNRIYGCDDCQLLCPWNRHAQMTPLPDFHSRDCFANPDYVELFAWSESEFLKNTQGSPIRRIGYARWQRNLAIGIGNALNNDSICAQQRHDYRQALLTCTLSNPEVRDAVNWALRQYEKSRNNAQLLATAAYSHVKSSLVQPSPDHLQSGSGCAVSPSLT